MGAIGHDRDEATHAAFMLPYGFIREHGDDVFINEGIVDAHEEVQLCVGYVKCREYAPQRPHTPYLVVHAPGKLRVFIALPNQVHAPETRCAAFYDDVDEVSASVAEKRLVAVQAKRLASSEYEGLN